MVQIVTDVTNNNKNTKKMEQSEYINKRIDDIENELRDIKAKNAKLKRRLYKMIYEIEELKYERKNYELQ